MKPLEDAEIDQAWRDLARHPQWPVARLKLVRMLLNGLPRNMDDRALREAVGRQSLAREILDLSDAIEKDSPHGPDERTYLARPQPVQSAGRGARRRTAGLFPAEPAGR
ncbi:MAG: hypothetical protein ACRCTG_15490 [Aestuariivirga sp.]